MSAILNSLNAHNFRIFQPILMKLVSKFTVYRALSDKTYLLLGLRSPLIFQVCISYKIMIKNDLILGKNGLCHSKLCILCNTPYS